MLVTIIIAAWNAGKYVAHAVLSASEQTHPAIEILVVDDGSEDNTSAVVRALASADARIRLLRHDGRKGVSAARNYGIREARGDWIAILDADDAFKPNRIERLLAVAVPSRLDMVADNLDLRTFETGAAMGKGFLDAWMTGEEDVTLEFLLERDLPAGLQCKQLGFMKPMIRREFLVAHGIFYREDRWAGEDLLLYVECLSHGARLRLVPEALYIYRLRTSSATNRSGMFDEMREANTVIRAMVGARSRELGWLVRRRGAMLDYEAVARHLRGRRIDEAMRIVARHPSAYLIARLGLAGWRRLRPG